MFCFIGWLRQADTDLSGGSDLPGKGEFSVTCLKFHVSIKSISAATVINDLDIVLSIKLRVCGGLPGTTIGQVKLILVIIYLTRALCRTIFASREVYTSSPRTNFEGSGGAITREITWRMFSLQGCKVGTAR